MPFHAGFVSIIGKPNSGKSTLLNAFVGEKISIITAKAQTTRHRIRGILSGENFQIVFSDTPGLIDSKYELHRNMMKTVEESLKDADILLVMADATKNLESIIELAERLRKINLPKIIALNKSDAVKKEQLQVLEEAAKKQFPDASVISISALLKQNIDKLLDTIIKKLPEHHAYYTSDELTDRSERFIVSETIREKIFQQFQQEVPYSSEVIIQEWKDEINIIKIRAEIIVERDSQKGIILGRNGQSIKQLGIEARKDIESFLNKKIFLGLTVKVNPGWRNDEKALKYYGY
ncbi:MAG: GTPase Era [Chitinophagales bacterium]|nr:GTPase Era [Chitinophagales bacterium]